MSGTANRPWRRRVNPECMVCGFGETCPMSALPWVFGDDTEVTPEKFCKVEDQTDTWEQAKAFGKEISDRLKKQKMKVNAWMLNLLLR